jgi:predicted PurR-regulated permease PerM
MRSARSVQPRLLKRIAWLLAGIVIFLSLAFCYFASSFCITLLLSAFLAILIDPLVTYANRFRMPRAVTAALLIVTGMLFFCYLGYLSYSRISNVVDSVPLYADRLRDFVQPLNQKIAKVQEEAGSLNVETSKKKVAEVRLREQSSWPSYLVRGVGPIWGTIIIIGVVPFLTFFNLIRKQQMNQRLNISLGGVIDVPIFMDRVTQMVRGFALGNLTIGSSLAVCTICVLLALKVQGAVLLGIVSGFLNLIPFLGVILAALLPAGAALLQFDSAGPSAIILLTVVCLHLISANFLIPKFIGSRVNIGPVAATAGILFWGWLWGLMGIFLAVPLTAMVKIIADSHPSLIHVANLLAESPRAISPWRRSRRQAFPKVDSYAPAVFSDKTGETSGSHAVTQQS